VTGPCTTCKFWGSGSDAGRRCTWSSGLVAVYARSHVPACAAALAFDHTTGSFGTEPTMWVIQSKISQCPWWRPATVFFEDLDRLLALA
jgi:hypothetical protein